MDLSGFADSETFHEADWDPPWGGTYQQLIYSTMIFPFTVYASAQRTLTIEVTRNTSGPGIYLSRSVALPGACSWLVTQ